MKSILGQALAAVSLAAFAGPATADGGGPTRAQLAPAHGGPAALPVRTGRIEPWLDGAVYRLDTAPGRVSDIVLQPGETLLSVAAGDTARWVIGDTASGSGAARRAHVLVKPAGAGLRTNLVIATDRRVYRLDLASGARAMPSISWTYPTDALLALERRRAALAAAAPVAAGIAVDRLEFGYSIEGDRPRWRPVRAFDDGTRVYIEFPPAMAGGEAPPLFVIGSSGRAELVNYRLRGHYYVVDRLFSVAELRLGGKHQQVVRIVRSGAKRRRGRGS
jgi:type IV secretion system protein VirB9